MNISEQDLTAIEEKLKEIGELDPADLPEPAAELADMLSSLLDQAESS